MKEVIIFEDDIHLAKMIKDCINDYNEINCSFIFTTINEFFENPIEADIYLLDIVMPGISGLDAISKILKIYPNSKIVMNSNLDDSDTIFKALQNGAVGYIDKESFEMNFRDVFTSIIDGGAYMTPKIARKVVEFFNNKKIIGEKLTKREKDILDGLLDGLSYKLIGDKFGIGINTVRMNITKIYRKLNINSKAELFKLVGYNKE
jgi:DNA-binding NarL/FixJ family response regulator